MKLTYTPLSQHNWADFEALFGKNGACGGCWCMWWRLHSKEYDQMRGRKNKREMEKLAKKREQIGLLAYSQGRPVGWCAFAPRERYVRLENSRVLKRFDSLPVWSVSCFFIDKDYRKKNLSAEILKGVIKYCRSKNVKVLESYPLASRKGRIPDPFAWTGFQSTFGRLGFKVAKRWSKNRPIMRLYL